MSINISTNMLLPIPQVGTEPGPDYATDVNNCLTLVDQHTHAPGYGVQITPDGLNLNSDVTFLSNNLTNVRSVRFNPQPSVLANPADLGCIYEVLQDLYYNDGVGNQVRLTQNGAVAGTPGSIANLVAPASASYVSATGTFVFQSDTNTSANIDGASFLFRNMTAASNALTLQPPASLSSNYTITLPTLPGATNIVTLTSSGVLAAALNVDNSTLAISSNQILVKDQGITQAKLAPRTTGTTVGAGGVAISAVGGNSTVSGAYLDVPNLTVTITTTGRPVEVRLISSAVDPGYLEVQGLVTGDTRGDYAILNGSSIIAQYSLITNGTTGVPASALYTLDQPAAGTYTYKVQSRLLLGSANVIVQDCRLMAYEI